MELEGTQITFGITIYTDDDDPAIVDDILGVPGKLLRRGDKRPHPPYNKDSPPFKYSYWSLKSSLSESADASAQCRDVFARLQGKEAELISLSKRYDGLRLTLVVYGDEYIEWSLEPDVLKSLAITGDDVGFDVYGGIDDDKYTTQEYWPHATHYSYARLVLPISESDLIFQSLASFAVENAGSIEQLFVPSLSPPSANELVCFIPASHIEVTYDFRILFAILNGEKIPLRQFLEKFPGAFFELAIRATWDCQPGFMLAADVVQQLADSGVPCKFKMYIHG